MSIRVTCEFCFHDFSVKDEVAGKRARCSECGEVICIPRASEQQRRPPASGGPRSRSRAAKPPAKSNTPLLIAGIGGGVAVLLVVVGVIAFRMGGGGDAPATIPALAAQDDSSTGETSEEQAAVGTDTSVSPAVPVVARGAAVAPSAGPAQPPTPAASKEPAEDPEKKAFSLADLIEQVEPSVVRINTKDSRGGGTGSGFVVDKDGTVVTNHHVIAGAASATVEFADGFKTPVLGYTNLVTTKDIAILKIKCDPSKLHPLPLAEKLPRKGESVVACGAPYGLSFSFSEGIVSAIRGKKELATFQIKHEGTWIQTTTPISSGNSGGPLINMKGEVVAANTLVLTIGQNLNFSVSSMDISEAIAKQKTPIAKLIPAKTRIAGSRRRPGNVDETKSERGRRLLGQIDELSLVMLAFNSDPIAGVDAADHVHSIIEKNITKLGGIPLKSNADTAMYVFMELDRAGTGSRKELILGSYVLVRDKNEDGPMQVVKVWEGRERLGNYSPAQVRKTHRLPSSVVKRVLEYLKKFREQHEAAAKELKEEGDSKSE